MPTHKEPFYRMIESASAMRHNDANLQTAGSLAITAYLACQYDTGSAKEEDTLPPDDLAVAASYVANLVRPDGSLVPRNKEAVIALIEAIYAEFFYYDVLKVIAWKEQF